MMPWERSLVNHATLTAWRLTWWCYPQVLVPLVAGLLVAAWRLPRWRTRVWWSVLSLLVSWRAAALLQMLFARPRRPDWVVKHETAFSYPSSHTAIVAGFYLLWAAFALAPDAPPPLRRYLAPAVIALSLGILWSRLALGAHYVSDLAGGLLTGGAVALAGGAIAARQRSPSDGGRSRR
jgi:membrane-associated phospholipid phosphatase